MGQQQLLLVILVTIIVGIATVVAINTFSASADSANVDAVRQDVAQLAASAQGYFIKPAMLGGGGNDFTDVTFNDVTFPADSISTDGLTAMNANGVYVIASTTAANFTVEAHPASGITGALTLSSTVAEAVDQLDATISADNLAWN